MANNDCYSTKILEFEEGLFDEFIDMTYIITMEDSPRNKKIIEEIERVKPTKKVVIVFNPGYKKCKKTLFNKEINTTAEDIIHVNKYIYNKSKKLNNILILEDDAEFSDEVFDQKHINNLKKFMNNNEFNTYSLGSIKLLNSLFGINRRLFVKIGTHAMIYSKKFRKNVNFSKYTEIDYITNIPFNMNGWGYYRTLVGQVFEKTINSTNWPFGLWIFQPILYYFTRNNCVKGIDLLNLIIKIIWMIIFIVVFMFICRKWI